MPFFEKLLKSYVSHIRILKTESTHKSANTYAGNVFVTRGLDL